MTPAISGLWLAKVLVQIAAYVLFGAVYLDKLGVFDVRGWLRELASKLFGPGGDRA